ncbi:short chain dehydrogenase/reductase family oxidoreductase [Caballeronia arationis]|jgi:NAD(P)-dependent dehydrogenase (short-subunit alcohol dehydrogenase family)|uniref:NAD(P)-dependent dehydrogenase, short-chain alcohol dehydrogenase family n=1 Tax=Caballeronia arationis TaxID=1777142 RepID=A0A7Z7N5N5_9BURK|nr:3-ketoacyl-ACP reductase [Caballeronia arationis]SAK69130.1 short chain dehydrogenase/reductase family oxidoreductase [Caballeronia arationis]SOE88045.1 NAD(P)-dependent dehydrogenase, short-chain alcohol dehydrogenase family [Caballeronia arationis]
MSGRPVALVTGSRRGIGRAIAVELGRAGFDVALTDAVASDELDRAVAEVEQTGVNAIAVVSDLADIDSHRTTLLDIEERLGGPIDCLVNNAGVSVMSRGDLLDVTPESFDRCIAVNTRGTFFLTQAFAKHFLARARTSVAPHPSVITITSSNAVAASPLRSEYCVSKAGLSMATTLFSLRLAEHGVGVYEVQPGLIETEMTAPSRARYDVQMEQGLTAIKRWGTPQEVATTVRTLATGGLPYSVGQAIRVDGGLLVTKY